MQLLEGGQQIGGIPPPSAKAVVADRASRAPATRMIRTSVFFTVAPFLLGIGTQEKHNPGKLAFSLITPVSDVCKARGTDEVRNEAESK